MKNKSSKRIGKILVTFFVLFSVLFLGFGINSMRAADEIKKVDFEESVEEFNNPDMGIYRPTVIICKAEGEWDNTQIQYANGLVHLRIGLKSFSGKGNGDKDYDITPEHIEKLNQYMQQVRNAGGTAVIRFAYDDFRGAKNLEPDMEQILKHIEELQPFFMANEDIIAGVETGFLGPYGEQHSSDIVSKENVAMVALKLAEVVPASRTISVRKPLWYCGVVGVDLDNIDSHISVVGTNEYRIGMFNDGYLGSNSDLGSFIDRDKALIWLNTQATHTLYGGEVAWVSNDVDENGNMYHSIGHIQDEMFKTHTSYINEEWNPRVLDEWKSDIYQGDDEVYRGKSAYLYVKNHLGYRIVLQSTEIQESVKINDILRIHINLKNVGAANVVNEKDTYVVLKSKKNEYVIPTDIDVRTWASRENKDFYIEVPITEQIEKGHYDIYLKVVNHNDNPYTTLRTIRFANEGTWNEEIASNLMGNVKIEPKEEPVPFNKKTSLYVWGVDNIDYSSFKDVIEYLNINTLYIGNPGDDDEKTLNSSDYKLLMEFAKRENLNSYIVYGQKYGHQHENVKRVRDLIDQVAEYNSESEYKILGIAIDSEFHKTEEYRRANYHRRVQMLREYVVFMKEVYSYASSKGLKFVACIPTDYDNYLSVELVEELIANGCDYVQLMNYTKETMIQDMSKELELAKKYNKPIETIAEVQKPGENGVTEAITYYYDGIDVCKNKFKEIESTYQYKDLNYSYHYYDPVVELCEEQLDYSKEFNYELYPKDINGDSVYVEKAYLTNGTEKIEGINLYNTKSKEHIIYFYGVEYLKNYRLVIEDENYETKDIKSIFYAKSDDVTKYDEVYLKVKEEIPEETTSKVTVRHLEVGTQKVLAKEQIIIPHQGESKYVTTDKLKEINLSNDNKYVLSSIEGNVEGYFSTSDIDITYWYAKKESKITVRYLEIGTQRELAGKINLTSSVDEEYHTIDKLEEINLVNGNKYMLVKVDGNPNGIFTSKDQVITYWYAKKDALVKVRYLELGTQRELSKEEVLIGKIDEEYITKDKIEDINKLNNNKYELAKIDGIVNGIFSNENDTITYWYSKKQSQIIVRYIELGSNRELAQSIIMQGKVDETYDTQDVIEEINLHYGNIYELVRVEGNSKGEYQVEPQIVTYVYTKKQSKVIVRHIEAGTNKELYKEEILASKIDDMYTTSNKLKEINDKNGNKYKITFIDGEQSGKYSLEEKVITYIYDKIDSKITIKYIELGSNLELLKEEALTSKVDDPYSTSDKLAVINDIYGNKYELAKVEGKRDGYYTVDHQTVTYIYTKKQSKVIIRHIEAGSNKTLYSEEILSSKIDDTYTTKERLNEINEKNGNKYRLSMVKGDAKGTYSLYEKVVTYIYDKVDSNINVRYVELGTNNELINSIEQKGKVDEVYSTKDMIDDINLTYGNKYELVRVEGNASGEYIVEPQTITYIYTKKQSNIIVRHIEKGTENNLLDEEIFVSQVDNSYNTKDKVDLINETNDNKYQLTKVEGNEKGIYTVDTQVITYIYEKKEAKVVVRYLEVETGKELTKQEVLISRVDDSYITQDKLDDINSIMDNKYKLVKIEGNVNGTYTLDEQSVTYWYEKQEEVIEEQEEPKIEETKEEKEQEVLPSTGTSTMKTAAIIVTATIAITTVYVQAVMYFSSKKK